MKHVKTVNQLNESILFDEFKTIKTQRERLEYCKKKFIYVGSGSSRMVFRDNDIVIKLAKNKKGIAQNENEISISQDIYLQGIVAELYNSAENGEWLTAQFARKIKMADFKKNMWL